MDDIKQYGDLNDKELREFLSEIETGDEDIQDLQQEIAEKIDIQNEQDENIEEQNNDISDDELEAYYGNDAWRQLNGGVCFFSPEIQHKANENACKANRLRTQRLKEDRISIQRKAFSQEFIQLSAAIDNSDLKELVALLVEEHTRMITKLSNFINNRLASLLKPLIPRKLRECYYLYPNSIKACPGFLYKASKEYGSGLTFWATPSVPYYFAQNTECSVLARNKPELLISVDKAVQSYYAHANKRKEKEIKYASLLIRKNVITYFDLLRLNPFWFELLYKHITKKEL